MKGLFLLAAGALLGANKGSPGVSSFAAAAETEAAADAAASAAGEQKGQQQHEETPELSFEDLLAAGGFDGEGEWDDEEGNSSSYEKSGNGSIIVSLDLKQLKEYTKAAADKVYNLFFKPEEKERDTFPKGKEKTGDKKDQPPLEEGDSDAASEGDSDINLQKFAGAAKEALAAAVNATQQQAETLNASASEATSKAKEGLEKVYASLQGQMQTLFAAAAKTATGKDVLHVLHLIETQQPLSLSDPAVKRCVQGLSAAGMLIAAAAVSDKRVQSNLLSVLLASLFPSSRAAIASGDNPKHLHAMQKKETGATTKRRHASPPLTRVDLLHEMLLEAVRQQQPQKAEALLDQLLQEMRVEEPAKE